MSGNDSLADWVGEEGESSIAKVGDRVGNYLIFDILGEGGFGVVTVKVWDAESGECISVFRNLPDLQWVSQRGNLQTACAISKTANEYLRWVGEEKAVPHKLVSIPYEALA